MIYNYSNIFATLFFMKNYKSPISWYGGKFFMADNIIKLFPDHFLYVEGFGGAAHVLFKKPPSKIEVYNDIHRGLYNLFKILRDDNQRDILIEKLTLTPYSREEFIDCRNTWRNEIDPIEKVRKFYTATMQSVGNTGSGWRYIKSVSRRNMSNAVSCWLSKIDEQLPNVIERLRELQIENLDIVDLIIKYDKHNTLFYLDPPYIHESRTATKAYDHEMSTDKHKELVNTLLNIKGKVILSGYDHEIYNVLLNNSWNKVFIGEYSKRSQFINEGTLNKGQEFVWINYEIKSV